MRIRWGYHGSGTTSEVAWGLVGGGITFSYSVRERMATQRFDKEHGEKG
jgi:hypothetical protein